MSTKQERAGKGDKWIQTCWEVMAGRRPRVLALLSILLGVWLGLSWSQSLWRADFNHKLVVKHAVHIHWLLHSLLLLLCSFLPRKGSSLATQMLAIGFQHELFQLRLFQWFLGISKVCGLRQLCLQANVCLTVVSRLRVIFLTSGNPINGPSKILRTLGSVTQSDQLGSERLAMNCIRTCLKIHRETTKYHAGSYGSCQRVVCRKEWDILKELWLPRHWLSALVYETMIFGPVLENGVTTCYEYYKAKQHISSHKSRRRTYSNTSNTSPQTT